MHAQLVQIREVVTKAKKHLPSVLQNESHPYLQEKDLRDFCRIHKIVFQVFW
jgi:aldehyde reductase